jgi:phosphatidylserine decarboxylase
LYSGNERLVCWLDTEAGEMALVMVGALLVAGIETVWQGQYPPGRRFGRDLRAEGSSRRFARGEEIGRFRFGSTVILLLPPTAEPSAIVAGQAVRMGQGLAQFSLAPVER